MTHRVAIVGAGPSGFYAADGLLRARPDLHIDIIDRLPTPYGLVRAGVAPDHQGTKAIVRQFEKLLGQPDVRFAGNIEVGRDLSWEEFDAAYDAVIVATGMVIDKKLGVPGEDLPHVWGSWRFVGWLNGHPDFRAGPDLSKVKTRGGDRQRQRRAGRGARAGQERRGDGEKRHRAGGGGGDRRRRRSPTST